jgi:hypothetical protein
MRTERWTEDKIIQKDICFECGSDNGIEYHHVVPYIKGGTKTIPLCIECHGKVHSIDFVKARELKKIGIQRAKERGVVFGRRVGVKEPIEKWLEKESTQKIIPLLKQRISYVKISKIVGCSISKVQKVSDYLKNNNINTIQNNNIFF